VETIQFMEVLNLKDSVEKDVFFRKLPTLAEQLSRPIVTKKVSIYFFEVFFKILILLLVQEKH
jgi:hypothetical protein